MKLGKGLLSMAVMAGLSLGATTANAALTIASVVGGAPTSGVNKWNFDAGVLTTPLSFGALATISFDTNAKFVTGSVSGQYAAPFLSGGNGTGFGSPDQPNGVDTTTYVTTGSTGSVAGAKATINFTNAQQYLGLLWGSVDDYNTISFYLGTTLVKSFTGLDVNLAANGNQGASGTYYVNITGAGPADAFNKVVFESSRFAFEFDNVAFGVDPLIPAVPLPAAAWLLLSGLGGLGILGRRRKTS